MPVAEIIAIGTELLLGEIQDTNTRYLARIFRDNGIDIYRATIVGDNATRVAQVIRESVQRANIIITTGGLGPTVDDPTREAVALAVNVELEYQPLLWEQIQARFKRYGRQGTENNKRQAYIPIGAIPVENLVGTAPAFIVECAPDHVIISLPGVPKEMEFLIENNVIPYLRKQFNLHGIIKAFVLHASGVGESQVDEWIGDLETEANPTVGLLAHPGQVDIRVTAKADSVEEADRMIEKMADVIRQRLGNAIYGCNDETLEQVVLQKLKTHQLHMAMVECGLDGKLSEQLRKNDFPIDRVQTLTQSCEPEDLKQKIQVLKEQSSSGLGLGISLQPGGEKQIVHLVLITPKGSENVTRSYGGPPSMAVPWAINAALDMIRKCFVE